jgi:glycosidase
MAEDNASSPCPAFEFHISKACRDRYRVDQLLFAYSGNAVLVNMAQAQSLAQEINRVRAEEGGALPSVSPAEMAAMGLLDEILHLVADRYRKEKNPKVFEQAATHLGALVGSDGLDQLFLSFTHDFPPLPVYRRQLSPTDYLAGAWDGYPNLAVSVEELLHLWLSNSNQALKGFSELFDDSELAHSTQYLPAIKSLEDFFKTQPRFGPYRQTLFELLRAPAKNAPGSVADQLRYIREHWSDLLPPQLLERLMRRILVALDSLREETKMRSFGPGPSLVPDYRRAAAGIDSGSPGIEPRAFSPDLDWMPNAVMIAKNVLVWLWQLSQKYGYEIRRLDQIPDAELGRLAECGFNTLWLIGVWERSPASQKIKRLCGNPEAVSSAYSLYDYSIAGDLGGDQAFYDLRHRAWGHGLRLAVDMVPNHTGLYSKWVVEHPDWFIRLDHPPFPSYSFNGPDLSDDPTVGLYLEDGYWTRSDAAVVFKRVDRTHGVVHYLYHGNDGTHMPWNDTAQLNFLLPQVREAVIQQILKVARYSPVIRFDAAMTLAKKHYQRLWFPSPGTGGDIPSRSWQGMTKSEFDAAFPEEFWRQVVDRVAAEAPDTLLLAEAFWLMEGYFVRSLGMHRVYNSAFMNMLKREENANYRQVLKNVLEFEPQILKRFVNFMNNPDEEPAAVQFGRDDKYFGVCIMMATLPGLPMFGHGQVEGFSEKYGMEYSRPYWQENVDQGLVDRHYRQVFPLLRQRRLFSGVEEFLLYDVADAHGHIQHDIFAYSNGEVGRHALVVFNNRYGQAAGWIKHSVPYRPHPDDQSPIKKTLAQGLDLEAGDWCFFRDLVSGLEYVRSLDDLRHRGLFVDLGAYQYHVFSEFRTLADDASGEMARLHQKLAGRGVPSIEQALWEIKLESVLEVYSRLLSPLAFKGFTALVKNGLESEAELEAFYSVFETQMGEFLAQSGQVARVGMDEKSLRRWARGRLRTSVEFLGQDAFRRMQVTRSGRRFLAAVGAEQIDCSLSTDAGLKLFYSLLVVESVSKAVDPQPAQELFLSRLQEALENTGLEEDQAYRFAQLVRILTERPASSKAWLDDQAALRRFLERPEVLQYLGCHWHRDVFWFIKEQLQSLLYWMFAVSVLERGLAVNTSAWDYRKSLLAWAGTAALAMELAETAGYDFNRFLDALSGEPELFEKKPLSSKSNEGYGA